MASQAATDFCRNIIIDIRFAYVVFLSAAVRPRVFTSVRWLTRSPLRWLAVINVTDFATSTRLRYFIQTLHHEHGGVGRHSKNYWDQISTQCEDRWLTLQRVVEHQTKLLLGRAPGGFSGGTGTGAPSQSLKNVNKNYIETIYRYFNISTHP